MADTTPGDMLGPGADVSVGAVRGVGVDSSRQLLEEARPPEPSEKEERRGGGADRRRRLERDVQRRRAIGEVEPRDKRDRSRRACGDNRTGESQAA